MAKRVYVRDNRGRFASTGATARGGRLRTAAGNKRATQTEHLAHHATAGTIGKRRAQEMNLEQYARKTGGLTRADTMSIGIEASRRPHGVTKANSRAYEQRFAAADERVRATKAAYEAAIKAGKIRAPRHDSRTIAQGHPDNPAVQAAQRVLEKTAAIRRRNNSVAHGNLIKTTDAMRAQRAQDLARAERKLAEMERSGSGTSKFTGSNSALLMQRAHVEALRQPLPAYRKPNRSAEVVAARNALARRRSERENMRIYNEFMSATGRR